jgi:hypothetical protein
MRRNQSFKKEGKEGAVVASVFGNDSTTRLVSMNNVGHLRPPFFALVSRVSDCVQVGKEGFRESHSRSSEPAGAHATPDVGPSGDF